jgi:hypothetical protein
MVVNLVDRLFSGEIYFSNAYKKKFTVGEVGGVKAYCRMVGKRTGFTCVLSTSE